MSAQVPLRKPWKDAGYPKLCEDIASADDLLLVRRFNKSHTRAILQLQDAIAQLEEELDRLDAYCRNSPPGSEREHSGTLRSDPLKKRQTLISELRGLLKEYDDFILNYAKLRAQPSAGTSEVNRLKKWFLVNNREAISPPEDQYMDHGTDVIRLVNRPRSMFRGFLEDHVGGHWLSKFFPARRKVGRNPEFDYYSNRGIEVFITSCAVTLALIAFIGPLWRLNALDDRTHRLGVITAFTFFFAMILTWVKSSEPGQAILGTATYAAVLMVYQQNP